MFVLVTCVGKPTSQGFGSVFLVFVVLFCSRVPFVYSHVRSGYEMMDALHLFFKEKP